jgi:hypothetical protein
MKIRNSTPPAPTRSNAVLPALVTALVSVCLSYAALRGPNNPVRSSRLYETAMSAPSLPTRSTLRTSTRYRNVVQTTLAALSSSLREAVPDISASTLTVSLPLTSVAFTLAL